MVSMSMRQPPRPRTVSVGRVAALSVCAAAWELVVAWLVLVLGLVLVLVLAVMAASIRTANAVSGPRACTALRTTVSGAICALPSGWRPCAAALRVSVIAVADAPPWQCVAIR